MNIEDVDTVAAERDASPERFAQYDPQNSFQREYTRLHPDQRDALHRTVTVSSGSSGSSSSVELQEIATQSIAQTATRRDSAGRLEHNETAMERIETHRTQASTTVGASLKSRTRTNTKPLPNFGAGKPYPPPLPAQEEYVVEFDGIDDPLHGQNWPMKKKLIIGAVLAFDSLCATMGSSIFSPTTEVIAEIYGVNREVTTLSTSLFVLGYAFGPMVWAPISELYGRKLPITIAAFGFAIFAIAVAVAKDLQTIIICRFFCGFFGSSPLAIVGAVFADIFNNEMRGLAIAVFSATVFMGPFLAPFIGGFITMSYLGWRWTEYISGIMGFTALALIVFFLEESYPPVILVSKARELRRRTKNWGIHAKQEEVEVDLKELVSNNVSRPFRILFTEQIVLLITIYLSFIYGLLYLFLTAYALVFQEVYGFNSGVGGLPYFGMIGGVLIGFGIIVFLNKGYIEKLKANDNIPVPEWRLTYVIYGGGAFAVGLFWFGWSGYTGNVPWIVPTLSGLSTGCGIYLVFVGLLNYLIDAYLMFAASTIAANTFLRSVTGCIFPLFATYMFEGMGIEWAATLLGILAVLLIAMPVYFLYRGVNIRSKSKFAPALDIKMAQKKKDLEAAAGAASNEKESESGSGEVAKVETTASKGAAKTD